MVFQKGNIGYKFRKNYRPKEIKFCKNCGKKMTVIACLLETKNFCSRKCQGESFRLRPREAHPSWKGGSRTVYRGYVYVSLGKLASGGRPVQLEHRVVMEKILGRKLAPYEQVHHINKIKTDNRPENLLLTTNKTHHSHHKIKTWARLHSNCLVCGTSAIKHHSLGRCEKCYSALRTERRKT